MKLSTRISLTITAVAALVLALSLSVVLWSVRRDETRDLDMMLFERAEITRDRLLGTHSLAVVDGRVAVPEEFRLLPHYAAVYDGQGRLLSATESFGIEAPSFSLAEDKLEASANELGAFDLQTGERVLRAVVLPVGETGHLLVYAVSRHAVDHDMRFLYRTLTAIFVVGMVLCWLGTRPIGRNIARDIQVISRVAHEVAGGKLEARVGSSLQSSDETAQLGEDLDYMIGKLEALMTTQREFLSHAAHELRSPLTTLRGEVQLALRRPREGEEYRVTLSTLLSEVEGLIWLTEDLLSLAKFESEALDPGCISSVNGVVQGALRMATGLSLAHDVRVEVVFDEAQSGIAQQLVRGAEAELARALRNLVDNALTLSPEGSAVTLRVEPSDEMVRIVVDDVGPGISAESVPHIFTPFYRGAHRRGTAGAGLGLSIARRIARAARGDVRYEEHQGRGARFVLELQKASARNHAQS